MLVKYLERAIERAATPEEIWAASSAYFRDTVVERVAYLHLPPLGAPDGGSPSLRSEGFPDELATRYLAERLYLDNPVLRHAQRKVEPIYWDEAHARAPANERERVFIETFKRAGLGDGVGIPAFGPNGRMGMCGLGFRAGVQRLDPAVLKEFQWVCQLAHLRYCTLLQTTLGPLPQLSRRETEVLAWVARGKSNPVIAEILGISSHTVDAHLRRIYLKLGVFDRISAAVRALGVGLIHGES
jgi:LuxR family transcriptional regulator/LuxR family quorum-sensing system transcriptional regulator CciR